MLLAIMVLGSVLLAPLAASGASTPPSSLGVGSKLIGGQGLESGRFALSMQTDGNLVERWSTKVIWASNTGGHSGAFAVLQGDGNLVIYSASTPLWSSGSGGHAQAAWHLMLQSAGNFFIADGTKLIWSSNTATSGVRISVPGQAAFQGDAPDPTVVASGAHDYAFTTGTALGNNLQVLVSSSPSSGFHSTTGEPYGSSALPSPPAWQHAGTETSPSVIFYAGRWRMFYDTYRAGQSFGTGLDCLSEATATTLSPTSTSFTDKSTGPLTCAPSEGGALDPSAFVDPATNQAWLIYKTNDGGNVNGTGAEPSRLFVERINANGQGLFGAPTKIWSNDTRDFPWETTLDDPDLIEANGRWLVTFSTGSWQSSSYAEAFVSCQSPTGPCTQPDTAPFLDQANAGPASSIGPGGGSTFLGSNGAWYLAYAAWSKSCASYAPSCGAVRQLYVAPFDPGV